MISAYSAVVPYGRSNRRRQRIHASEQLFHAQFRQRRIARHRFVEVVDIRLVMLVVVDLHRLRVDIGLQRVIGIGEFAAKARMPSAAPSAVNTIMFLRVIIAVSFLPR